MSRSDARSTRAGIALAAALALIVVSTRGKAADDPGVAIVAKLSAATVTVRMNSCDDVNRPTPATPGPVLPVPDTTPKPADVLKPIDDPKNRDDCVTICTGVVVSPGLIVTSLHPGTEAKFRITMPGGEHAGAKVRVVDHHSGLLLLAVDRSPAVVTGKEVAGKEATKESALGKEIVGKDMVTTNGPVALENAERLAAAGSRVYSAAAWGNERPAVSEGILSSTERYLPGTSLPRLLQCDLRAAPTSGGAAIVDRDGKLQGIVVASDVVNDRLGWTYAVPATHVTRLIKAQEEGKMVVLERRRPLLGLSLDLDQSREPHVVRVRWVDPNGPAAKAGIRQGAEIVQAEGQKVRSPYEVVKLVLNRLPGDPFEFIVRQSADKDGAAKVGAVASDAKYIVTLGGGRVLDPPQRAIAGSETVAQPQVSVTRRGSDIQVQQAATPRSGEAARSQDIASRYNALLDQQRNTIEQLQADLRVREAQIEQLRRDMERLKKLADEKLASDKPAAEKAAIVEASPK